MGRDTIRVQSALTLEAGSRTLASQRWIDLLAAIGTTRSISAAAKAVGLSYKGAWDAVEAMNNLAHVPLVERRVGGKGGGGTLLTRSGRQLVATFRAVHRENARFLQAVNARLGGAAPDLRLLGRIGMLTSARNHFVGRVARIARGAVNDEVQLALPGGQDLVAVITRASVVNLGLKVGAEAIALVKASSVIVAVDDGAPLRLSARNDLPGLVRRVTRGAVSTEVAVEIGGGNSVVAIITNTSAKALRLKRGSRVRAIFKASSVILGVGG